MSGNKTESWVDRYRPETWNALQGNNSDLDDIKDWADNWQPGDSPQLLVGDPGTGKTSTAEVVANHLGVQVDEINASSARTSDDVAEMSKSIQSADIDGGVRLILIDEVDSWHHAVRKRPLYDALDAPANPVICTANDEYDTPNGITNRCDVYDFTLQSRSIKAKLKKIRDAEDADISDADLEKLAERPDLRSAINDMQRAVEDDLPVGSDGRSWETSEWDMLDQILTGTPDTGSVTPPDAAMYIDECLTDEYRGLELTMSMEALSLADVRLGLANEQGYHNWRYAGAMIEQVAHIRQTEPYFGDHIGGSKGFPEWFRHSVPDATGGSDEAKLYRALKGYESGEFRFAGSFNEFQQVTLPLLQDLSDDEKFELVMSEGLDAEEMQALGVTQAQYEQWREVSEPKAGDGGGITTSVDEW